MTIYSDSFKSWFGDWEHDKQGASKVVDGKGKPLVMYHGSKESAFSIFSTYECGQPTGAYFTDNPTIARSYARLKRNDDFFYETYLNLRNPKIIYCENRNYTEIGDILCVKVMYLKLSWYKNYFHNIDEAKAFIDSLSSDDEIKDVYINESHDDVLYSPTLVENSSTWHDGVIFKDVFDIGYGMKKADMKPSTVAVAYQPEQIKSINNNGAFDAQSGDIYA